MFASRNKLKVQVSPKTKFGCFEPVMSWIKVCVLLEFLYPFHGSKKLDLMASFCTRVA